jgi:hypothetical protein
MPLIYGEGMQAFRRLQEQIIKSSVDLTTFAWEKPLHLRTPLLSPLATSPARFAESHCIENYKTKFPKFSVTNKGLLLSIDIPLVICHATLADGRRITVYMIHLGIGGETLNLEGGIYLRKIGPDLFCRAGDSRLAGFEDFNPALRICASRNTTVLLDTSQAEQAAARGRVQGLHVPRDNRFYLIYISPEMLWDETDRMFLRPQCHDWADFPMLLIMLFQVMPNQRVVSLAVLCHNDHDRRPVLKIFTQQRHPEEFKIIRQARYYRQEGVHVQELDIHAKSN